jgi:hypothetical protein
MLMWSAKREKAHTINGLKGGPSFPEKTLGGGVARARKLELPGSSGVPEGGLEKLAGNQHPHCEVRGWPSCDTSKKWVQNNLRLYFMSLEYFSASIPFSPGSDRRESRPPRRGAPPCRTPPRPSLQHTSA